MRLFLLGSVLLFLLTACSDPQIDFAQPFPQSASEVAAFPVQHQGVYVSLGDTTHRLTIAPAAIWSEEVWSRYLPRQQLDSLQIPATGRALGVWQIAAGSHYRLRPGSNARSGRTDSVWLDRWMPDTICVLRSDAHERVRWFRGAYYLSHPSDDAWDVQRLALTGSHLSFQHLSRDTLQLATLPAGVARRVVEFSYWRSESVARWHLVPTTRRQERQIARNPHIWVTEKELDRQ